MLFKERNRLAKEYIKWVQKNNVDDCPLSVITFLDTKNLLQNEVQFGIWFSKREDEDTGIPYNYKPHWRCPLCQTDYDFWEVMHMNYCPKCGAKTKRLSETRRGKK